MRKLLRTKYAKFIFILVTICLVVYTVLNWTNININPFKKVSLENPSYITMDNDGNKIILDKSGMFVLKVNKDDEVVFSITEDNNFYCAKDVVCKDDGGFFVLNIRKDNEGFKITHEDILEYSANGDFKKTICSIDHENGVRTSDITKLYCINDQLYYSVVDDTAVYIQNSENKTEKVYEIDNAKVLIKSVDFGESLDDCIFLDKRGYIFKVCSDQSSTITGEPTSFVSYRSVMEKNPITLEDEDSHMDYQLTMSETYTEFSADQYKLIRNSFLEDADSIPWDVCLHNDSIYYTDIGKREIYKINEESELDILLEAEENLWDNYLYYRLDINGDYILASSEQNEVLQLKGDESAFYDSFSLSSTFLTRVLVFWLLFGILIILLLIVLVYLAKLFMKESTATSKRILAVLCAIISLTSLFIVVSVKNIDDRMTEEVGKREKSTCQILSDMISADAIESLENNTQYMNDDYKSIRKTVRTIMDSEKYDVDDMYCVVYKCINEDIVSILYQSEDDTSVIHPSFNYQDPESGYVEFMEKGEIWLETDSTFEGNFIYATCPIYTSDGRGVGFVEIGTDMYIVEQGNRQFIIFVFLNVISIAIMVTILIYELVLFISSRQQTKNDDEKQNLSITRPMVFLIYFITNIAIGFFSIYSMNLANEAETLFGMTPEFAAALPFSAEVFFGAIMSLYGTSIVRSFGKRRSVILGSTLFILSSFILLIGPSIWSLIIGKSVCGLGWGMLLLIINSTIASVKDEEQKDKGFAGCNAAMMGGANAGLIFGSFLCNWFSAYMILVAASLLSTTVLILCAFYVKDDKKIIDDKVTVKKIKMSNYIKFLMHKEVWIFLLCIVIPSNISSTFLGYCGPIIGSALGISETNIGYIILLNGLIVICCGGMLVKFIAEKFSKYVGLTISILIYALAFISLALSYNALTLILVSILLGITSSFGFTLQQSYYTELRVVETIGQERAIGVYTLFDCLAESMGSIVFSFILILGLQRGLITIVSVFCVLSIAFLLSNFFSKIKANRNHKCID